MISEAPGFRLGILLKYYSPKLTGGKIKPQIGAGLQGAMLNYRFPLEIVRRIRIGLLSKG
jgi:hypothetical protein